MPHDEFQDPGPERPQPERRARPRTASPRSGFDLLSPKSIRSKLVISMLFIFLLGSLATFLALYSLSRMQGKIELIEHFYELNQKILETRRYEKNFLLYGNRSDLKNALQDLAGVRAALAVLRATPAFSRATAAMLPRQETRLEAYADLLKKLDREKGLSPADFAKVREQTREQGHALTQSVLEMDAQARREVERSARWYRNIALFVLLFGLVSGAGLTLLLVHWIIGPLRSIRRAAARIMRGELTAIPLEPSCRSSIECLELVDSLNLMLHTLEITKKNQLIQSAKLADLGRITAGIAHEINNPLNNIFLTAEVLLEELPDLDATEWQEMVNDILTQADRARDVIHHLLDFSRSRESTGKETVDAVALLKDSLVLLRNQIRLGRIQVHTDLPAGPLPVTGNANQLQQVFVNIILNAVQAMGSGGILSLKARTSGDSALVEFTDTGPGIPQEIRARIFEPFFTTKSDGTGLGLSVSFSIIRAHQGDIVIEDAPAAGTTFRVILPLRQGQPS